MALSREDYIAAGMGVLAEQGHLGLKLAEVCRRLHVTSGSFYHCFDSWTQYKGALIDHWKTEATTRHLDAAAIEADPYRRVAQLIDVAIGLDHGGEAAIRAWSCADPDIRTVQIEVDALRHSIVLGSALQITAAEPKARQFANAALYLLTGYEQATIAPDLAGFAAILRSLLGLLVADDAAVPPVRRPETSFTDD